MAIQDVDPGTLLDNCEYLFMIEVGDILDQFVNYNFGWPIHEQTKKFD